MTKRTNRTTYLALDESSEGLGDQEMYWQGDGPAPAGEPVEVGRHREFLYLVRQTDLSPVMESRRGVSASYRTARPAVRRRWNLQVARPR